MDVHAVHPAAIAVFCVLFGIVAVSGFFAVRWRRADLSHLNEWGLAGRRFGTWVTWFLVGGDIYTAYTFIAVPAAMFSTGAAGFFAFAYTTLVFPVLFVFGPRLWAVCKRHGYITAADFVRGRFDSDGLALATAFTGILATLPYIGLQLVGLKTVIAAMGISGDWPVIIAFVILAVYTFQSGLRAPALTAVIKDLMVYVTVGVAIVYIPIKLGGFGHIFGAARAALPKAAKPAVTVPGLDSSYETYATLALGSAFALFLYPHALTGALSADSGNTIRRNATLLTTYSLALGAIAVMGYMAIAAGLKPATPNFAVPDLFIRYFPPWFQGFGFAAIGVGALVPAAIMSIAASNLFSRNIWRAYVHPDADDSEQTLVAKIVSLLVKLGALCFALFVSTKSAIDLQLLGGVWILQTLPAVFLGLYTRWFDRWALLCGWAVGMGLGTWMAASQSFVSAYPLHIGGLRLTMYAAFFAIIANLIITCALTPLTRRLDPRPQTDATAPGDYDDATVAADGGGPELIPA
ncbi:MAG TPA: sodium:solute symporter family protein [Solirubrobacteraceae bacterium]|nr:sodium:solute symporter family protein [Solirubrobacteraceae bacterium]